MSFAQNAADRWHRELPGVHCFKTDLHIHTIEDHPVRDAIVRTVGGSDEVFRLWRLKYGF